MSIDTWIALGTAVATIIVVPFLRFLYRLDKKIDKVFDNHFPHFELYLKLICDKLDIPYESPRRD